MLSEGKWASQASWLTQPQREKTNRHTELSIHRDCGGTEDALEQLSLLLLFLLGPTLRLHNPKTTWKVVRDRLAVSQGLPWDKLFYSSLDLELRKPVTWKATRHKPGQPTPADSAKEHRGMSGKPPTPTAQPLTPG